MLPTFIFLSSPSSEYEQVIEKILKTNRFQHHVKQNHRQEIRQVSNNQKFIDSPLSKNSTKTISLLQKQLKKVEEFDTVVVAPLRKSLQTCYQLFKYVKQTENKNNKKIYFYIEPLLADHFNSTSSIGNLTEQKNKQEINNYRNVFENFTILEKSQWMSDLLPKRIKDHLNKDNSTTAINQSYHQFFQSDKSLSKQNSTQSPIQFAERLDVLKQSLLQYERVSGTNKKVLLIASADLLNNLAATDFYENGDPVNPLRMSCGQVDIVSLITDGTNTFKGLEFQSILPFCR